MSGRECPRCARSGRKGRLNVQRDIGEGDGRRGSDLVNHAVVVDLAGVPRSRVLGGGDVLPGAVAHELLERSEQRVLSDMLRAGGPPRGRQGEVLEGRQGRGQGEAVGIRLEESARLWGGEILDGVVGDLRATGQEMCFGGGREELFGKEGVGVRGRPTRRAGVVGRMPASVSGTWGGMKRGSDGWLLRAAEVVVRSSLTSRTRTARALAAASMRLVRERPEPEAGVTQGLTGAVARGSWHDSALMGTMISTGEPGRGVTGLDCDVPTDATASTVQSRVGPGPAPRPNPGACSASMLPVPGRSASG